MNIQTLAQKTEDLIFQIGQQASHKELHGMALSILMGLHDLQSQTLNSSETEENTNDEKVIDQELEEIAKAERKLAKWSKDQNLIPAQILTAYLQLIRGKSVNTEAISKGILKEAVKYEFGDNSKFSANFDQMKNIYKKNHAKIFDVNNRGHITIWPKVGSQVRAYELEVLGNES